MDENNNNNGNKYVNVFLKKEKKKTSTTRKTLELGYINAILMLMLMPRTIKFAINQSNILNMKKKDNEERTFLSVGSYAGFVQSKNGHLHRVRDGGNSIR